MIELVLQVHDHYIQKEIQREKNKILPYIVSKG